MKFFWSKLFGGIFAALLVLGLGYQYKAPLSNLAQEILDWLQPCERPITYSLGNIDSRFGISNTELLADINKASAIWGSAINRQLFKYSRGGDLKINLVYDNRQQATDTLRQLGITINDDKATYDTLKAKYDAFVASYNTQKVQLSALIAQYDAHKTAYENAVNYWNSRGGAPPGEYATLQKERSDLDAEAATINQDEASLNELADTINSTATILNKLVAQLNAQGNTYNTVGASNGTQFQEGEYVSDASGREIDIFQFDNEDALVRVLAHEFGHALGMQHVNNPKAIMYYLNEGINEKVTADDLAELKRVCRIP